MTVFNGFPSDDNGYLYSIDVIGGITMSLLDLAINLLVGTLLIIVHVDEFLRNAGRSYRRMAKARVPVVQPRHILSSKGRFPRRW